MSEFSFGTDPEFMLKDRNQYISAIPVIKSSHQDPTIIDGHRFYWDNVLAECAVKPAYSKEEAVHNIGECLGHYAKIVSPTKIVIQASQNYPESAMQDKGAREAGCKPDNCVYSMCLMKGELSARKQIENTNFRTCGGHIHLGQQEGVVNSGDQNSVFLIYLMDLFLGVPSIFMDIDSTAPKRRTLYGQAGRYREKSYGMEYRSLSSFWLSSPTLVELVYDISNFIIELLEDGQDIIDWNEDLYWDLRIDGKPYGVAFQFNDFKKDVLKSCIDNSNRKVAKEFMNYVEMHMPATLYARLKKQMAKRKPYDLYKEWSLC